MTEATERLLSLVEDELEDALMDLSGRIALENLGRELEDGDDPEFQWEASRVERALMRRLGRRLLDRAGV